MSKRTLFVVSSAALVVVIFVALYFKVYLVVLVAQQLQSENRNVRAAAAKRLPDLYESNSHAYRVVLLALESPDTSVLVHALDALRRGDPASQETAIPRLIEILATTGGGGYELDRIVQKCGLAADNRQAVLDLLEEGDAETRRHLLGLLTSTGCSALFCAPRLLKILRTDSSEENRDMAGGALKAFALHCNKTGSGLGAILKDLLDLETSDLATARARLRGLSGFAYNGNPEALSALKEGVRAQSAPTRAFALFMLSSIQSLDSLMIAKQSLLDQDADVRANALESIETLLNDLNHLLEDGTRSSIRSSLARVASNATEAEGNRNLARLLVEKHFGEKGEDLKER